MKIIRLEAENFKRLSAVEITPAGNVIKITGANTQGKTSVLDAIWAALAGGDAQPEQPIRKGASRATVRLDLGDLIVERRYTAKSSELIVTNKTGARYPSPQKMLDSLIGRLTFDPLQFLRYDPKKQGEILRQLAGIDFAQLDCDRKAAYEDRTIANRRVEDLRAQGSGIVVPADAPDAEVDPAALLKELQAAQEHNAKAKFSAERAEEAESRHRVAVDRIQQLRDELAAAEEESARLAQAAIGLQLAASHATTIDVTPIQARIADSKRLNEAARAKSRRRELGRQFRDAEAHANALTQRIAEIDEQKAQALGDAKLPVPGLGLDDEGTVTFDSLPLSQASSAEQLRVSIAMAMALNPKLRILRIADGSLLDSKSMAMIETLARENDYQCWIESVDETGKVGVVIQDGHVAADNQIAA